MNDSLLEGGGTHLTSPSLTYHVAQAAAKTSWCQDFHTGPVLCPHLTIPLRSLSKLQNSNPTKLS